MPAIFDSRRTARTGAIFHDYLLTQRIGELLHNDARDEVHSAARRIPHNQAQRLHRIALP